MKILVVDDEKVLVKGIKFNLESEGYQVEAGYDGEEAVELARSGSFDLIILDLMMPKIDGLQACMRIREFSNVPIIMLTARSEDTDKIIGFECGADDYITKPFNILELKARVRALLRRAGMAAQKDQKSRLTAGHLVLDADERSAFRDGTPVDLEVSGYCYLSFRYTLTGGGEVRRTYYIPVDAALLDDPDTPAARLDALVNTPGQMEALYFCNYVEGDTLAGAYLSAPMAEDGLSFNSAESRLLLEAVRSDLAAGRLGRHYLMEDRERMETCYFNDLTFTFYPTGARESAAPDRDTSYVVTITLQTTASETLGVLEQLGASGVLVSKGAAGF